jgi:hypothetical protein
VPSPGLSATHAQDEDKGQDGGEHGDHDGDLHTLMIPPRLPANARAPGFVMTAMTGRTRPLDAGGRAPGRESKEVWYGRLPAERG